jgi:hypothetical protein
MNLCFFITTVLKNLNSHSSLNIYYLSSKTLFQLHPLEYYNFKYHEFNLIPNKNLPLIG